MFIQQKTKQLLAVIFFFGLAGAVWGGWDLYGSNADYPLTIMGAVFIGILGGLGLSIFSKNWKFILKTCGLGLAGSVLGFSAAFLGIYHLPFSIGLILSFLLPNNFQVGTIDVFKLFTGIGSIPILIYLLNFILAGLFIGLFFAMALKNKIWPLVWRGGLGFGLGSIISPVTGNLLGNLFGSFFISYILTFSLIGIILGLFLFWGTWSKNRS